MRSSDGRDVKADEQRLDEVNGGDSVLAWALLSLLAAVLRSVWRLFWNQMVTDFISLMKQAVSQSTEKA